MNKAHGILLLLIAMTGAMAAPPVERLFLTPEERRQIELHPERADPSERGKIGNSNGEEDKITVNGLVIRNNGKRTVWVNKQAIQEGQSGVAATPLSISKDPAINIALPGQALPLKIKPGQSFDQITGTITESFNKKPDSLPQPSAMPSSTPQQPNMQTNSAKALPLALPSAAVNAMPAGLQGKSAIPAVGAPTQY
jgi:hypothetical protein